jgi:hypothetical protein
VRRGSIELWVGVGRHLDVARVIALERATMLSRYVTELVNISDDPGEVPGVARPRTMSCGISFSSV